MDKNKFNKLIVTEDSTWLKDAKRRSKYKFFRRIRFILLANYFTFKRKIKHNDPRRI